MMEQNTAISKAILHILDNNITVPVISNNELDIDGEISEFLEKHISKIFDDTNLKEGMFSGENNSFFHLCRDLKESPGYFIEASIEIANRLFEIMLKNIDIVPADIVICQFSYNNQVFLGILKLNYKTSFTHYVQPGDEGNINSIIRHRTILPSESQKVDECVLICLDDFSLKLIEKEYEINGERGFYLSKLLLDCRTEMSSNEKIKIIDKTVQKINRKYFDDDFEKVSKLKKIVAESLEETSAIHVAEIAQEVFENNINIQREYIEEVQKSGLMEMSVEVPEKLAERKFKTQKIKTDNGIEINFPSSYYNNKEKIEFVNNPDGTISIIIKNVGKISNR